jgi:hypothetical protein
MSRYVVEGEKNGYSIEIKLPKNEWSWDYEECSKKNSHFVPKDKIKKMAESF